MLGINLKSDNAKKVAFFGIIAGIVASIFLPAHAMDKVRDVFGK